MSGRTYGDIDVNPIETTPGPGAKTFDLQDPSILTSQQLDFDDLKGTGSPTSEELATEEAPIRTSNNHPTTGNQLTSSSHPMINDHSITNNSLPNNTLMSPEPSINPQIDFGPARPAHDSLADSESKTKKQKSPLLIIITFLALIAALLFITTSLWKMLK